MTSSITKTYTHVAIGEELPALVIPITRTLIVASAIASRDYQDVHHDAELAKERGSKDIFMNILTTNGLVGRYVTDWSGPGGVIREISIRLGAPNHPDDTMTMKGAVAECLGVDVDDKSFGRVALRIKGENSMGTHVSGTVVVALPMAGDQS